MIIDIHTHMINGKDLDSLTDVCGSPMKKALQNARGITKVKPQATDVVARVAQMDRCGIDYQLATPMPSLDPNNMPLDTATEIAACKAINDSMARITEESKGRIMCAGAVPLSDIAKQGGKEMERVVKHLGLKGFSVTTNIKGKPLDAPQFRDFWACAAGLTTTVFLHPADSAGTGDRSYEADYELNVVFGWPFETTLALCRLVFSGVMEEFPGLKIVNHHLGGMIPFYWARMQEHWVPEYAGRSGVALKRPMKEYFGKFYYDTAVGDSPDSINQVYKLFGADHLVFATDAPFGPGNGDERLRLYPEVIRKLALSKEDINSILGENAKMLLAV